MTVIIKNKGLWWVFITFVLAHSISLEIQRVRVTRGALRASDNMRRE